MKTCLAAVLVLAFGACGCTYPQYVNDDYRYVPLTTFAYDNQSYRIFDKPSASKLIVTPSLGMATSDSVIRNATFGRYNNSTSRESLEAAVAAYLTSNGRNCSIMGGTLIYDPQWEFTYSCKSKAGADP